MKCPLVSVVMATYNHENYVENAIKSVLEQKNVDFEFLITDDGSSDNTREVVAQFSDKRIKFYPNLINRGACVATNDMISRSTGEYIALINSDDCWTRPDKLQVQSQHLRDNPDVGATFGNVMFIDKDGESIDKTSLPFGQVFDKANRSRGEWLRYFFDHGNCLCHPSILIRRSIYSVIGEYNNKLRQLPDYLMWIQLVKQTEIYIDPAELVKFRILPGENASSQSGHNSVRTANEHLLIAKMFFEGVSSKLLQDGFGDLMINKSPESEVQLNIEKALLFFNPNESFQKLYEVIGFLRLFDLMEDPIYSSVLNEEYGIDDKWFQKRAGEIYSLRALPRTVPSPVPDIARQGPVENTPKPQSEWKKFRRRIKKKIRSLYGTD